VQKVEVFGSEVAINDTLKPHIAFHYAKNGNTILTGTKP
jgi:hypothetical protein